MPTISGTNGNDTPRGTSTLDVVWGLDGSDTFVWQAGDGDDFFHGGSSSYDDDIYGPKADGDRLFIDGPSVLRFSTTDSGTLTSGGETLTFTGVERIHLGDGNDVIWGHAARLSDHGLTLYAGSGDDTIDGSRFNDFIDGGSGHDHIYAGAGEDHVQSSTGDDFIDGGADNDNIRWGQGDFNERIGNDTILGGSGDDLINVWVKDTYGENGTGVLVKVHMVDDGSMTLGAHTELGPGATSSLRASEFELGWTHEGRDTVSGAEAVITGRDNEGMNWNTRWGDDVLTGTQGNDTLEGGNGRDTITGGAGDDLINLGEGSGWDGDADTVVFRAGHGRDVVYGFEAGRDVLDLGGQEYDITQTWQGVIYSMGEDSILIAG